MAGTGKTLSFGLVNVPVKLHPAQREAKVAFRILTPNGNPIRASEEVVDSLTGELFTKDQTHKGYEFRKGSFIEVTAAEVDAAKPEKSGLIEIEDFVLGQQLSPLRIEKVYWLAPDVGGERAYLLLLAAMLEAGKIGIARMVANGRQHLAAIVAMNHQGQAVLSLCQLYFDDELLNPPALPALAINEKELELAMSLIESKVADFDLAAYADSYRTNLMQLIESKVNGTTFTPAPQVEAKVTGDNLLEALAASVAAARAARKGGTEKARAARKRSA